MTENDSQIIGRRGVKGGIVFFSGHSFISRLIRFFTGHVTHVALIVYIGERILLLDSDRKKFYISYLKKCSGHCLDVEIYQPVADSQKIQLSIDRMMDKYVETPYSIRKFLGHGWAIFLRWIGFKNYRNPVKNGYLCGDQIQDYLVDLGFEDYKDIGKEPTPEDLYHKIKEDGRFKKVVPFYHVLY